MVLVLHEMPAEARTPVLREVTRVAKRLLCLDYRVPMPWNLAGALNLSISQPLNLSTSRHSNWSERMDSNHRPPDPKPGALPDCATLRQKWRLPRDSNPRPSG